MSEKWFKFAVAREIKFKNFDHSMPDELAANISCTIITTMIHRHLNHQEFTLAAIDDIIARGQQPDWIELRDAALSNPTLLEKVRRVCSAHVADPYAQRFHFWMHYAKQFIP